jgi:hypothetical protein
VTQPAATARPCAPGCGQGGRVPAGHGDRRDLRPERNLHDCKFNYNYTAARHQALLFRHWQDKGKGAGTMLHETFHGDIADA